MSMRQMNFLPASAGGGSAAMSVAAAGGAKVTLGPGRMLFETHALRETFQKLVLVCIDANVREQSPRWKTLDGTYQIDILLRLPKLKISGSQISRFRNKG